MPAEISSIKIYGERNTGTNYLAALLERNVYAKILPGRVDDTYLRTILTRRLRRVLPRVTHAWHEVARDKFFAQTFKANLGWKHMNPDPARIGAEALTQVRFVMLVKNPYAWLLSLYQRPYHVGARDERFEDFLDRHLGVMEERENIGPDPLTPVEVWNRKMRGYQGLQQAARHAVIVRYEDFLADERLALEKLAQDLGVPLNDEYLPVEAGVKQEDKSMSHKDYMDYYLQEHWRSKLSTQAIDLINAKLDPELAAALGYALIAPETSGGSSPKP